MTRRESTRKEVCLMGCHSHGPESTKMFRLVTDLHRGTLEGLVGATFDLRPSEVPEFADWDFYRQVMIDLAGVQAGEIKPREASWYELSAFKRAYNRAARERKAALGQKERSE